MKILYSKILSLLVALLMLSCVDEYQDFNPPPPLDAPYAYVSADQEMDGNAVSLIGGEEVTFTVNIVDAPGVLSDIAFTFSKGGEVISHTFDALKGQTSGSFNVTVRAPSNLNGETTLSIDVSDSQPEPQVLSITRVLDVAYAQPGPDFTVDIEADQGFEADEIPVTITINSVPSGAIKTISVAGSAGTVVFDQAELDALIGQSSGTITGTLTVGPVASTGTYDISVAITDDTQNRQVVHADEILLICSAAVDISGTYEAISSGETGGANGQPFFHLIGEVVITQLNAGQFEVNDMSFGVYPGLYGDDAPAGVLNVCGLDIEGVEDNVDQYDDPFTITGQIIEATPEAITIEWSNTFGDTGTVSLVKQ